MSEKNLTSIQQKAVEAPDGEFVVKAGAGTGKTRVLVNKYINIYEREKDQGRLPEDICDSILTVTFTRKAAKEMLERLSRYIPDTIIRSAHISTIDAFCARFLKENALAAGIDSDFKVLDEVESKLIFRKLGTDLLDDTIDWPVEFEYPREEFLNEAYDLIALLKQNLISPEIFIKVKKENQNIQKIIFLLYRGYDQYLEKENLMDFGKLLFRTYSLLQDYSNIKDYIQNRFKYVLVDEYQDTNPAQIGLLRLIAEPQNNYFVVGDEKQSIYGFRGAMPSHITDMFSRMGESRKIVLEDNFRTPEPLPALVNAVFSKRLSSYHPISSSIKGKASVELFLAAERTEEAEFLARKVRIFLDAGFSHNEIVILFRGVKNCREYEEALKRYGIDTVTIGGMGFYQQPEIKDILSFLLAIDNPHSDRELLRVMRSPAFGFENSLISGIAQGRGRKESLYTALCRSDDSRAAELRRLIESFRQRRSDMTVVELVNSILEKSGLLYWAVSKTGGRHSRQMTNLNKFVLLARKFESRNLFSTLNDFSEYLRQLEEIEVAESEARPKSEGVVNLMSIHQAKGLEFPVVFISNISRQNFPAMKRMGLFHFHSQHGLIIRDNSKDSMYSRYLKENLYSRHNEEERRLLYVAMTRSMKHLILTGYKNYRGNISRFMEYFLEESGDIYKIRPQIRRYMEVSSMPEKIVRKDRAAIDENLCKAALENAAGNLGIPGIFKQAATKADFSVTEIEAYAQCPMLYRYRYLMGLPEYPSTEIFSPRLFGTIVHRVMEEYYRLTEMSRDAMTEKAIELLIAEGVSSGEINRFYKGAADSVFDNIFDSELLRPRKDILFTEKPFVLKFDGYYIKGTIDRVDKAAGKLEVIDYKTSRSDDVEPYRLQLGIYGMALESVFSMKVDEMKLFFVREGTVKSVGLISFIKQRVRSLLEGIATAQFYRIKGHTCRFCAYKQLCGKIPE